MFHGEKNRRSRDSHWTLRYSTSTRFDFNTFKSKANKQHQLHPVHISFLVCWMSMSNNNRIVSPIPLYCPNMIIDLLLNYSGIFTTIVLSLGLITSGVVALGVFPMASPLRIRSSTGKSLRLPHTHHSGQAHLKFLEHTQLASNRGCFFLKNDVGGKRWPKKNITISRMWYRKERGDVYCRTVGV